jgi:AraC family transcriptional regulator
MAATQNTFTVRETHGILLRSEHEIEASSDRLGWSSMYVSMQHERPYHDRYPALDDHLIVVHRNGPVVVRRDLSGDRLERTVYPGGLFVLPARCDFGVELCGSLSTIHLYIRHSLVCEAAAELGVGDSKRIEIIPRLGEHDGLIENLAHAACDLMHAQVSGDWAAQTLARALAMQLVCKHSTATLAPTRPVQGLSKARLNTVHAFIEANIGGQITLEQMAIAVNLTPIHFARQFKKSTGRSPHQYLLYARVETAKRLLQTDLSIAEIAFRCGFSHQEHLTRMFGRLAGSTPAAYRRTLRS